MTASFLASGALLGALASGRALLASDPPARAAAVFLGLAGIALAMLAFATDPSRQAGPPTLHGRIHDAAFICVGAAMLAALILFGIAFFREKPWSARGFASLLVAAIVVPAFRVKGTVFVVFLAAILAWCEMIAIDLWRSQVAARRATRPAPRTPFHTKP
jgi:hypothetical protein